MRPARRKAASAAQLALSWDDARRVVLPESPARAGSVDRPTQDRRHRRDPRRRDGGHASVVYFLADLKEQLVKIGCTGNLALRIKDLQSGHPRPLHVLKVIEGGFSTEKHLQRRFASYRLRADGEWFELGPIRTEIEQMDGVDPAVLVFCACVVCGKATRSRDAERCKRCEGKRRGEDAANARSLCRDCGKPLRFRRSKRCMRCYVRHRSVALVRCLDCGELLAKRQSKRCAPCTVKHRSAAAARCLDCGERLRLRRFKRCASCAAKHRSAAAARCLDCGERLRLRRFERCGPCSAKHRSAAFKARRDATVRQQRSDGHAQDVLFAGEN